MRSFRFFTLTLAICLLLSVPARAVSLLRDPGIEYGLAQVAKPILTAAGLSFNQVKIMVINSARLNAFVIDTRHIFISSGLILKLDDVTMLQSVIAHETAHIVNGHLTRRHGNLAMSKTAAGLGIMLAAATAIAGNTDAAAGMALGTNISATRRFFSRTRAEETAADQYGVQLLVRANIDPRGAVKVMQIFAEQEFLSANRQDPYARSHPFSSDRIRSIQTLVELKNRSFTANQESQYWFDRARGKLSAFIRAPKYTLRAAKQENSPDVRLIREAVAHFRQSNLPAAKRALDDVLALRPNDGFIYDLYGEILLKSRKPNAAVNAYRKAVEMNPTDGMILGGLGRALLADEQTDAAIAILEKARSIDFKDARILHDLAVAYAKAKRNGMAALVTAERFALQGSLKDAMLLANRAKVLLPEGSRPWRRAVAIQQKARSTN